MLGTVIENGGRSLFYITDSWKKKKPSFLALELAVGRKKIKTVQNKKQRVFVWRLALSLRQRNTKSRKNPVFNLNFGLFLYTLLFLSSTSLVLNYLIVCVCLEDIHCRVQIVSLSCRQQVYVVLSQLVMCIAGIFGPFAFRHTPAIEPGAYFQTSKLDRLRVEDLHETVRAFGFGEFGYSHSTPVCRVGRERERGPLSEPWDARLRVEQLQRHAKAGWNLGAMTHRVNNSDCENRVNDVSLHCVLQYKEPYHVVFIHRCIGEAFFL